MSARGSGDIYRLTKKPISPAPRRGGVNFGHQVAYLNPRLVYCLLWLLSCLCSGPDRFQFPEVQVLNLGLPAASEHFN
jgi:hypothetical protein